MRGAAKTRRPPPPRVTLTAEEAADALGVSDDFFRANIAPELRVIRRGQGEKRAMRLYPVRELERWAHEAAALTVERCS